MSRIAKEYMEHQRKRWTRHDAWRFLPPSQRFEAKFDPNQPRVPTVVRREDNGQLTAAALGLRPVLSELLRQLWSYPPRGSHLSAVRNARNNIATTF
jgi:hypothetical protein